MQSKSWIFTYNGKQGGPDPPATSPDDFDELLRTHCSYWVYQQEIAPTTHTVHYQGYVELAVRRRLDWLRARFPQTIHWEVRAGTQAQAVKYASKSDTRDPSWNGHRTGGEPAQTAQGARTDIAEAVSLVSRDGFGGLKRLREERPVEYVKFYRGLERLAGAVEPKRDVAPQVHLLFGPPGCGKTRRFYDDPGDSKFRVPAGSGFWFDGYELHKIALLDDFDGGKSKWPLAHLLETLDRYSIRVPIKGGFVWWAPEYIYVSTNFHPRDWYDWSERAPQWAALRRRFTKITWWRRRDGDFATAPLELNCANLMDQTQLDHFWEDFVSPPDKVDYFYF